MNRKNAVFCLLLALTLGTVSQLANGAIVINGWTINLDNVAGQGLQGNFTNVNQIGFHGLFHNTLYNADGTLAVGGPVPGQYYLTDGVLLATALVDAHLSPTTSNPSGGVTSLLNGGITIPGVLDAFQLTFDFHIKSEITSIVPTAPLGAAISFVPLVGPGSTLDVYIANLATNPSANTDINGAGGSNFTVGELVASFAMDAAAGDGGVIQTGTLNGDTNNTFHLVSGDAGVFFDGHGNDLTTLPIGYALLAMTNSTLQMDPDGNLLPDSGPPSGWSGALNNGVDPFLQFFGVDDGHATLAVTPEPMSFLVWGGLIGMAVACRTIRRKKG